MSVTNKISNAFKGGASKRLLILGGAVIAIGATVFFLTPTEERIVNSSVKPISSSRPTIQGKEEVTPAMNSELSVADQQRFDSARETGGSAIPTIRMGNASALEIDLGDEASRDLLIPERPEPPKIERPIIASVPPAMAVAQPVALRAPERANPQLPAMVSAFSSLPTVEYAAASVTQFEVKLPETPVASAGSSSGADVISLPSVDAPSAGTILYAQMVTEANSDAPGPVLAEILQGEFAGARLVGSFTTNRDNLVLQFRSMTVETVEFGEKRSETVPIQAVAVDASSIGTGVASSVDYHLIQNVGVGLAAAFVEGFGEAAGRAGSTVVSGTGGITIATDALDTEQQLYAAAGEAASVAGQNLNQLFGNRAPTIKVASGTPVGIFFLGDGVTR